jgi:two-component sensor histidine kinase
VRDIELDADARARLELILSELVTNSVVHSGGAADAELSIRLRLDSELLRGEVCGEGPEFDWAPHDPDLEEPGGLGLMIVDQLTERWGIQHNSQVCVWFECSDCGPGGA